MNTFNFILTFAFAFTFTFTYSFPTRRILHQPLFPADQPFFPNGSTSQSQSQTLPPQSHPPPPPPIPSTPKPTKEFTIAISVGVVALGMLSALAFFIYKHKVKPNGSNHTPTKPPTTFLDPATDTLVVANTNGKHLNKSHRYRPSPDLQPLPPLRSRAVAPDHDSPPLSSEDDSAVFYTPQGSVASSDVGRSRLFSAPEHAVIIPSIKTAPPPPPPLPHKIRQVQPPPPPPPPPPVKSTWTSVSSESELKSEHNEDGCNRADRDEDMEGERPKLKPLHWDKVQATSDRATVWDHLKSTSSSFQLNEDMMESLFGCNLNGSGSKDSATRTSVLPPVEKHNRVFDPNKSQNIAILLRALNVTRDQVSQPLLNGNPEALGAELLETLVKMAPTKEEEIKLKDYKGDSSKLGSAEKFLKEILDIPFAFRRVEAMLYRANFDAEIKYLSKSFVTLETASGELKNSRLFLKLLEAVLRTGNRMNVGTNRGDAKAFKLDTLLKLVDIKGTDGKTTLLHFVVQEIFRSEGTGSEEGTGNLQTQTNSRGKENEFRRQGLQMVSGLSRELGCVKLAAGMDSDVLHGYVLKLETGLEKVRAVLKLERPDMEGGFFESMKAFLGKAEEEIFRIKNDERKALTLVREVMEYFHGNAAKEEAHPFRIFMIVRDFLSTLDHVCKDVGRMQDRTVMGAARSFHISSNAPMPVLNRYNGSRGGNSSEESSSP